jgi:hypothetical protein
VLDRTPYESVFHYRGDVFKGWKWGWLTAMQPTVLTRAAMEANGPLDTSFPIAACFGYLAKLCRRYTTNLISAPGCIKHEYGAAGEALKQEHVVSGRSAPLFHGDVLRWHEELFSSADPSDHDAQVMRGFRQYLLARACAQWGRRDQALKLLDEAMKTYPMPEVRRLRRLLRLVPNASASRAVFRGVTSLGYRMSRLASRLRRRG